MKRNHTGANFSLTALPTYLAVNSQTSTHSVMASEWLTSFSDGIYMYRQEG